MLFSHHILFPGFYLFIPAGYYLRTNWVPANMMAYDFWVYVWRICSISQQQHKNATIGCTDMQTDRSQKRLQMPESWILNVAATQTYMSLKADSPSSAFSVY